MAFLQTISLFVLLGKLQIIKSFLHITSYSFFICFIISGLINVYADIKVSTQDLTVHVGSQKSFILYLT